MHRFKLWAFCAVFAFAGVAATGAAHAAQSDPADRIQRARIQAERRDAQVRFDQQMAACSKQFAAAACQDLARSDRRAALDALRHQQLVLDDAQRRGRAAARLRAIENKAAAQSTAQAEAAAAAQPLSPAASAASAPRRERVPRAAPDQPAARASAPPNPRHFEPRPAPSPAEAERRKQQSERRASENERHRLEVMQRNAERDRKRPPATGLPLPPSASASSP